MEQFDFPPFELDKYRIVYMEDTDDPVDDLADGAVAYENYRAEVSELVLRLLLLEETHGRTELALPDTFSIKHEDYILHVDMQPWTTPQRFRFFRKFVDQNPSAAAGSPSYKFINHQRLVCWPFKYTFTFTPRIMEASSARSVSDGDHSEDNGKGTREEVPKGHREGSRSSSRDHREEDQFDMPEGQGKDMEWQHERSRSFNV
ncbi:hypothetical protein QFC20_000593 [Naganishia adeliensis]|uniref:Uncharacterized protein n=1 Tax=Naganishia adeliensis TaxID=92952 RepID=A0ACC2WZA6_9TREE|nr:hypothetical protein QFC20_000593 [Naganishia adeliensis]